MITGKVLTKKAEARIDKIPRELEPKFRNDMEAFMIRMQTHVKNEKLSGQVLKHRTGNLRRSVHYEVRRDRDALVGVLATGKQVPYARVHEFGGTVAVKAHKREIRQVFGRQIEAKTIDVKAHSAKYPERSFMRTTLAEFARPFKEMIRKALEHMGKKKK